MSKRSGTQPEASHGKGVPVARTTAVDHIISGATAGLVAGGVTHPLDVVRLRRQLRQRAAFRYPGLCGALAKEAAFSGVRVAVYQTCAGDTQRFARGDGVIRIVCGGAAGVAGTIASHPIELVKVVKVVSPANPSYARIVCNLVAQGDVFRAILPAIQRSVVFSAAQLASYDVCKREIRLRDPALDYRYVVLLAAWIAGVASTALSTPLDVAKTRLIVSDFRGTFDCLRCIARYEGLRYLWNGSMATWVRLGPYTLVQMVVWESTLEYLLRHRTAK